MIPQSLHHWYNPGSWSPANTKSKIFAILLFSSSVSSNAIAHEIFTDSIKETKISKAKLTVRVHSMGMFSYSGRIASNNPTFDLNFTYDRKTWGFLFFKAENLCDPHASNNFSLALFYKNIHIGSVLTVTPNVGFILDQEHKIADPGSDAVAIVTTAIKLTKNLTFDNSTIFSNLVLEHESLDWVNRFRLLYTSNHLDITLQAWHNNKVFDSSDYFSAGLSTAYSRIKISNRVHLSAGITGLMMVQTSDETSFPKKNGLVFTMAAVFN